MFSFFPLLSLAYSSSLPDNNVSAGCSSAFEAFDMAQPSCPITDLMSFVNSNSSSPDFPIQILCENPACKGLVFSISALFIDGACYQDTIPNSDGTTSHFQPYLGSFISTNYALTCQKTSDNKGYCGASSNQKSVITTLAALPFMPSLGSQASVTTSQLIISNFAESDVCTDCSKNGFATVLADINLSEEERSSVQNVSTELDAFCGNSFSSVPIFGELVI